MRTHDRTESDGERPPSLGRRLAALAADNQSGASSLVPLVVAILREVARGDRVTLEDAACAVCRAQPAMAALWNAAAAALRPDGPEALAGVVARAERAPAALARVATGVLIDSGRPPAGLAIATLSASSSVRHCLVALSKACPVRVVCAEGRPVLEGRALAGALAAESLQVTLCTDAALGGLVADVDAVLIGADAISPTWLINKSGSHQVAAIAAERGVPVYSVAGRLTFIGPPLDGLLELGTGPASEVWRDPPLGVRVANPYFERVPLVSLAGLITDAGFVDAASAGDVRPGICGPADAERLAVLLQRRGALSLPDLLASVEASDQERHKYEL